MLDAIDRLADDPRPAGSFLSGSPDLRRLRARRYRVLYEPTGQTVAVRHIARGTGTCPAVRAVDTRNSSAVNVEQLVWVADVRLPGVRRSIKWSGFCTCQTSAGNGQGQGDEVWPGLLR